MLRKATGAHRLTLSTAATTLRLLYSVNARPHGARPSVNESDLPLAGGHPNASLFEPRGSVRKTLVLVHGVTGRANADPLMVHLARSLGALGYRCVVPSLRHLSQFRHDPRDIDTLVEAIDSADRLSHNGVAVLAFSYGASYALCAAADPRVSNRCSALVGFGAYYDLQEALKHQGQLLTRNPRLELDDADLAYLRYTLLACHRDQLDLSVEAWLAIDPILVSFTSARPLSEVRAPLLRFAQHIDFVELMRSYQRRDLPLSLSPAHSLSAVRCAVGLLHDPDDRFVPPNHVERIRSVLDARPMAVPTAVLTTPMLSHVQVNPMRRLFDLPRLVMLLEPVLGGLSEPVPPR